MQWKLRHSVLSLDSPKIMGILNVTPDSFSDGGLWLKPEAALEQALRLEAEGADVLDIGAESSRPGASALTSAEEWKRLQGCLAAIRSRLRIPISVDTRHADTAQRALELGVDAINDVSCAGDERLLQVVAEQRAGYVLMHTRGCPQEMMLKTNYSDFLGELQEELGIGLKRCIKAGIEASCLLVDPGFGFAKTSEQNWILLRSLPQLRELAIPILVGVSRKKFLREIAGTSEMPLLAASLTVGWAAIKHGASLLRVHDVRATRAALKAFQMSSNQIQSAS